MIRLHRDTGLQLLENKVLSRGITRKSACILAEITIRKSQGITFLDNTYGPEWSHKINWEALDINDSRKCILGQLEGRYEGALQKFNAPESFGADHGFMPSIWESSKKLTAVWREFGKYRLGAAEMY